MTGKADLVAVCRGTHREVRMLKRVADQFAALDPMPRLSLLKTMQKYADGHDLPPTLFRHESKEHRGAGKTVSVFAFKHSHVRVYGVMLPEPPGMFVCSEIDTAKKQNRADPGKLERAASNASHLFED